MIQNHLSFVRRAAHQDDTSDRVRRFLPMVHRLAWHVNGSGRPGIEIDDLVQSGLVALTECAQRHDGPSEDGFAAYAKLRVRGAMFDLVRRNMHQTRGAAERRRQLGETERRLAAYYQRAPSEAELAGELSITIAELSALRHESAPLVFESINESYTDQSLQFASLAQNGFDALSDSSLRERLAEAVVALPKRLQLIIQLYFVDEMNLAEIAAVIDVSTPRVHQLKAQALEILREKMADEAIS
jgi:RNA polymerase sigma factor FliA